MKQIKYFFQYIVILFLFIIFKILGLKYSSILSGYIVKLFGPIFRSNKISYSNIGKAFPDLKDNQKNHILKKMWNNYGAILAEYMFIKKFRTDLKFQKRIKVINKEVLEKIILNKKPVIFVSGHFNNFELMAMQIEQSGIDLAAIYRPLNNNFLNPIMEKIRKKYICKHQIKKGISGTKELLKCFRKNISIALMIDQRVSEGIACKFFNQEALTTTIPAQFVKKFNTEIIPVHIERFNENNFTIEFSNPLDFSDDESIYDITLKLNKVLEKMILKNPDQWIWTHNRWK
jgi:Kdo2-lipid IVA lauroyltransferase/acyltransferase|tara:strand:+ start:583 stop:1446 length:864 start_codon:yes stop_codon:yes gene_type:complete